MSRGSSFASTAVAVIAFAVAMGYLESAVVIYLRAALGQSLSSVPAVTSAGIERFATTEVVRELATLVMISTVGWLAGHSGWERLAWSAVVFGTWDVVYYLGLYAISAWPPAPDTWDVLFLVPATWVGPVWAPVTISVALIVGGLWAARRLRAGLRISVSRLQLTAALGGAVMVVASFLVDSSRVLAGDLSPWTGWPLLLIGICLGALGLGSAIAGASPATIQEPAG